MFAIITGITLVICSIFLIEKLYKKFHKMYKKRRRHNKGNDSDSSS